MNEICVTPFASDVFTHGPSHHLNGRLFLHPMRGARWNVEHTVLYHVTKRIFGINFEQNLCKSNENQLLSLSDSKLLHVCLEGALPNEVFLFGDICKVYGPKMSKLHVHSICSCTVVSLDCSYASGVRSVFVKISRHKTFRIYSFAHCFLLVFVSSNKHFPSSSSSSHVQD